MKTFEQEVKGGERFEFGKNWNSFLSSLNEQRIKEAEKSLCEMLELTDLKGKRFLDIGSGSGLFSLAARRLGASVYSFDYDPMSVACNEELKRRYFSGDDSWIIDRGSALDQEFLKALGKFDIVYSWGVLHHTGDMKQALDNVDDLVDKNGILFIAIYNHCNIASKFWWKIKKLYCSGTAGKIITCGVFIPYFFLKSCAESVFRKENVFLHYRKYRGMSILHDWIDWLGGFPYEYAKVEDIFSFFKARGFSLRNIKTTNSTANNQFVFVKN
ncbi:MAG: class I SAM-dependent methyltransferase [Sedimentisphaerales bacterium]|jgi:2-polyprenyl-6-hydroxyphenyl methylase/3-demethylubiquinone-9 3-methyltransferase